jgi:hypothetical protein
MDEFFNPSCKVSNYTFNFMSISSLSWLTVLWHLSKTTKVFLVACVHYNYKWVTNSIFDFQVSSSEGRSNPNLRQKILATYGELLLSINVVCMLSILFSSHVSPKFQCNPHMLELIYLCLFTCVGPTKNK